MRMCMIPYAAEAKANTEHPMITVRAGAIDVEQAAGAQGTVEVRAASGPQATVTSREPVVGGTAPS